MSRTPERQLPSIENPLEGDMIKIMLATDNHIGYMERDPIRGQDSINTFREILQLAVKHDVDFILLAGDLFHENRPSRDVLYQTMSLLREYTMGDKPIQIELLSDPDEGKASGFSFPAINYEDPNFNVGIPVFSIHGNHDDPQGAGPEGALCALDLLSAAGLMNYMGKFDLPLNDAEAGQNSGIAIRPVLLGKGSTKLGLYGVGNVKDARMHFELRSNRVRMFMPRDKDEWFNILLIHQNRVKHGPQEFVPEGMFDDSIDLVVWGHEHDCQIVPDEVPGKQYKVSQPGSSVATSLSEGEAIEKHVALLEIQGKEFRMTPIPLRTVRPFVLERMVLAAEADEQGFELSDQIAVAKCLRAKINELIDKANAQWDERNAAAVAEGEKALPRMLPLVRLKVDVTGVSAMSNPIRFGQEFSGRIANPRDVLVFERSKSAREKKDKVSVEQPDLDSDQDEDMTAAEKLSKVRVHSLVKEYLTVQELQLLGEEGMSDAIQLFVDKDDAHAIQTHVNATMNYLLKNVKTNKQIENVDEDDLDDLLAKAREQYEKEYTENGPMKYRQNKGKGKARDDDSDASMDSMMQDIDVGAGSDFNMSEEGPRPKKKTTTARGKKAPASTAKKAPAKGRGKKKAVVSDDEDEDPDVDEEDEKEEPRPAKKTSRAAVLSQTAAKKAPAKKKAAASAKQSTLSFAPSGRSSTRAAASRSRAKTAQTIELDSD